MHDSIFDLYGITRREVATVGLDHVLVDVLDWENEREASAVSFS